MDASLFTKYEELDIMLPLSEKSKNRLYLCWKNTNGVQCKMIGPQTKCFCNHRFKQHEYIKPNNFKKVACKAIKCKCKCYDYIPAHGAYDFKCLCKHSYKQHDCITKKCKRNNCTNCNGFASAWTCSCGSKFINHQTIIETYQERKNKGKSINDMVRMNQQLNSICQIGSLMKPIKMDPQAKLKSQKKDNIILNLGGTQISNIEDSIEQFKPSNKL